MLDRNILYVNKNFAFRHKTLIDTVPSVVYKEEKAFEVTPSASPCFSEQSGIVRLWRIPLAGRGGLERRQRVNIHQLINHRPAGRALLKAGMGEGYRSLKAQETRRDHQNSGWNS